MPESSFRDVAIVGIDPGSQTLGISTLYFCPRTFRMTGIKARTQRGDRLAMEYQWVEQQHPARATRIYAHQQELTDYFHRDTPVMVAAESPFYNRRQPNAFGALTEVITAVRAAVMNYHQGCGLELVDPPTAKIAVGAGGRASKDEVKAALLLLPDFNYIGEVPFHLLDEHSTDAMAVAYWLFRKLRGDSQC